MNKEQHTFVNKIPIRKAEAKKGRREGLSKIIGAEIDVNSTKIHGILEMPK